jgi:hypothetical protein
MLNTAKSILTNGRSYEAEADNMCMSIKEILELIPGTHTNAFKIYFLGLKMISASTRDKGE